VRYTTLRIVPEGVVLLAEHRRRLAPEGAAGVRAFDRFLATAAPGVWSVRLDGAALTATARAGSRLFDGVPLRRRPSPFARAETAAPGAGGPFPKPAPPCPYDAVRADGVLTLLSDADGSELWEACVAALVGWSESDGGLVLPPKGRPRVASVAEAALARALPVRHAPLRWADDLPLAAVNAVAGPCPLELPGRAPFPVAARVALAAVLAATTRRP
jgi:hypothetical protein